MWASSHSVIAFHTKKFVLLEEHLTPSYQWACVWSLPQTRPDSAQRWWQPGPALHRALHLSAGSAPCARTPSTQRKSCPWPPEQCFTSLPPCQERTEAGITGTRIFSPWLTLLVWWMFVPLGKEQVYPSGMKFDQQQGCLQIGPKGFLRFWPLGQMPNSLPSLLWWPVYLGMILVRSYLCESCP